MSRPRYRPLRIQLSEAQNHRCAYCGIEMIFKEIIDPHDYSGNGLLSHNHVTIDHIKPQCKGGKWHFYNCVAACAKCNNERADSDPYAFFRKKRKELKNKKT